MKKWILDLQWLLIFVIVWIILFGKFSIGMILSGIIVGVFCLWTTEKFLIGSSYYHHYPINIFLLVTYSLHLIIEIYASGFETIKLIITGNINPKVVVITTELDDDYSISILANSITLTPGTVTIDKNGNELTVLWLNAITKDPKVAGRMIKGNLENRLKRGSK
jgi:multicomponent Na+:H+ antiporter subunit E